jgi:superfamily I DNA/RNA helicase
LGLNGDIFPIPLDKRPERTEEERLAYVAITRAEKLRCTLRTRCGDAFSEEIAAEPSHLNNSAELVETSL